LCIGVGICRHTSLCSGFRKPLWPSVAGLCARTLSTVRAMSGPLCRVPRPPTGDHEAQSTLDAMAGRPVGPRFCFCILILRAGVHTQSSVRRATSIQGGHLFAPTQGQHREGNGNKPTRRCFSLLIPTSVFSGAKRGRNDDVRERGRFMANLSPGLGRSITTKLCLSNSSLEMFAPYSGVRSSREEGGDREENT